jgi:hypothetical protein
MAKVCTYCGYTAPRKDPELKRHGAPDGCFSHLSDLVPVLKRELRKRETALTASQAQAKRMAGAVADNWLDEYREKCLYCGGEWVDKYETPKAKYGGYKHAEDCPKLEAEEILKPGRTTTQQEGNENV